MNVKRSVAFLVFLLCLSNVFAAGKHRYTLVIDAGHGGKDAGACSNGAKEKNINLNVALAFGRYVESNCPDVRVIYTRKTDVFIPLHERAAIANRNKADVFVSIHTNALPGKKPKPISGMETYTMGMRRSDEKLSAAMRENEVILIEENYQQHYSGYDPRSPESMMVFEIMNETNMAESVELARLIQQHTSRTAGRPNKGVRQDAFLVLRETSMPACLVELGYITTPSDRNYLTNKTNVDLMGRGIYQAFVAFKNKKQGKTVTAPAVPSAPVVSADPVVPAAPVTAAVPQKVSSTSEPPVAPTTPDTAKVTVQQPVEEIPIVREPKAVKADIIFKVQLFASSAKIKSRDARMKGLSGVDSYQEGGLWKYTIGASENYNEIYNLRKQVLAKFPQAFIIAFRDGVKMDAAKAYQEFKQKRNIKK